jgi:hypothetical protein
MLVKVKNGVVRKKCAAALFVLLVILGTADNFKLFWELQQEFQAINLELSFEEKSSEDHHDSEKEMVCFVYRWTKHYGGNVSDFIMDSSQCYCALHPPCRVIIDDEDYRAGDVVNDLNVPFSGKNGTTTKLTSLPAHFGKLLAVQQIWKECDIIVFSDLDVHIINFELDVRDFFASADGKQRPHLVFSRMPISGVNAGGYALRTTDYSEAFIREWWQYSFDPNQRTAHGDQGALYDMLLKRVSSRKVNVAYTGECRRGVYMDFWGRQTGCFNEWMLKLGYQYPDWDIAWENDGGSVIVVRNPKKLQGFPYEKYGNRPAEQYASFHYEPFNYSHVLDECAEPGDFMVHFSKAGLSIEQRELFRCEDKGWKKEDIFGHVSDKEVYSTNVHQIPYAHKQMTRIKQMWTNKDAPREKIWSVPKANKLQIPDGLPGFIGVGCGHCGSTSLYTTLMQHPQMVPGNKKELLYLVGPRTNKVYNASEYASLFPPVDSWQMTGEFSPYYIADPEVPGRIRTISPHSKILLMLRDPLSQCRSAYGYQEVKKAMEAEPSCDFHKILTAADRTERKRAAYHPCDTQTFYLDSVRRWQENFGPDKLLLISSEDFKSHHQVVLRKIEAFLGLPHFDFDSLRGDSQRDASMHVTANEGEVDSELPQAHCFDDSREQVAKILEPHKVSP